ncbi:hypothetical protein L9F63_005890, partial [Diploptera punctata]
FRLLKLSAINKRKRLIDCLQEDCYIQGHQEYKLHLWKYKFTRNIKIKHNYSRTYLLALAKVRDQTHPRLISEFYV